MRTASAEEGDRRTLEISAATMVKTTGNFDSRQRGSFTPVLVDNMTMESLLHVSRDVRAGARQGIERGMSFQRVPDIPS